MGRALLAIAVAVASSAGPLADVGHATTWLPPSRPLTQDEKLELAVSESDAIGFGYVAAVRETIVDVVGGTGIPARSLTLRPTEWLWGAPGGSAMAVGFSATDHSSLFSELLVASGLDTRPACFFLKHLRSGWALRDYPDPPPLQLLTQGEAGAMRQRIRRIIALQSPDSLLARADLVVLGVRGETDARCATSRGVRECAPVSVKEVLAGPSVSDSIVVYGVMLGQMPPGEALYLLRKMPDGLYETVGFRSGSLPVRSGKVERWGLTLEQTRRRALAARTARPAGRRGAGSRPRAPVESKMGSRR